MSKTPPHPRLQKKKALIRQKIGNEPSLKDTLSEAEIRSTHLVHRTMREKTMQNGIFCHFLSSNHLHLSRMFRLLLVATMLTFSLGMMGCERSGQRLKMSKPPSPLVSQRHQQVKGNLLAGSRKALVRSAQLNVSDAVSILGGFTYAAQAKYQYKKGLKTLRLTQTYRLEQRADGIFRMKVNNSRDKGYEVRWINGVLYQRDRYRPFRITSREIEMAHRWQRRGYGRWRSIVGLFGPRLALSQNGEEQLHQRTCIKYQIALHSEPQKIALPKEGSAWDGPVPNSTRGAASKLKRKLLSANGEVWVDQKSGLVLKVNFTGRYKVGEGKESATATLKVKTSFVSLGDPDIKVPIKTVSIKREPEPKNPFVGSHIPPYMKPPPSSKKKKKKRLRRR